MTNHFGRLLNISDPDLSSRPGISLSKAEWQGRATKENTAATGTTGSPEGHVACFMLNSLRTVPHIARKTVELAVVLLFHCAYPHAVLGYV
jgi:hypothetical protein